MDVKMPKPRRRHYRYFSNFDIFKYENEWFIRFPHERHSIYFGDRRAMRLVVEILEEIDKLEAERVPYYVDGVDAPLSVLPVFDLRLKATEIARRLLNETV